MKNKNIIVSVILFLPLSILVFSYEQKEAKWKGIIEEENGVIIVKNPKEPIYGEDVFSLEEELSIGESEGREEYMFPQINGIAVDEQEKIYVLDLKEAHIKVFNETGNYIKTIGKKGKGPGELNRPIAVFITSQNEIVVQDRGNHTFNYYTIKGEFIRSLSTARVLNLMRSTIDSNGNIISAVIILSSEKRVIELKKFDPNLNILFNIASSPMSKRRTYNPSLPSIYWQITADDHIVYGISKDYKIQVLDPEGKVVRKIIKEYDPVKYTKKEIEWLKKNDLPPGYKRVVPKYHTSFLWISIDDEGRIFVGTWEKPKEEEGYYYDVFDQEGRYIAKIVLKMFPPLVWKKKRLYTIEEDEEGYQVVKRYKVNWNI